jgi:hypothetical protein
MQQKKANELAIDLYWLCIVWHIFVWLAIYSAALNSFGWLTNQITCR